MAGEANPAEDYPHPRVELNSILKRKSTRMVNIFAHPKRELQLANIILAVLFCKGQCGTLPEKYMKPGVFIYRKQYKRPVEYNM
jgi:hypothetical protein